MKKDKLCQTREDRKQVQRDTNPLLPGQRAHPTPPRPAPEPDAGSCEADGKICLGSTINTCAVDMGERNSVNRPCIPSQFYVPLLPTWTSARQPASCAGARGQVQPHRPRCAVGCGAADKPAPGPGEEMDRRACLTIAPVTAVQCALLSL